MAKGKKLNPSLRSEVTTGISVDRVYGKRPKPGAYPSQLYRIAHYGDTEVAQQLVHGMWAASRFRERDGDNLPLTAAHLRKLERKVELINYDQDWWAETFRNAPRVPLYLSDRYLRVYFNRTDEERIARGKLTEFVFSIVSMTTYDVNEEERFFWVQKNRAHLGRGQSAARDGSIVWERPESWYFGHRKAASKKLQEVLAEVDRDTGVARLDFGHSFVEMDGVPEKNSKGNWVDLLIATVWRKWSVAEEEEKVEREKEEQERKEARKAERATKAKKRNAQKKKLREPSLGLSTADFAERVRIRREMEENDRTSK